MNKKIRKPHSPIDPATRARAVKMLQQGKRLKEVAEATGIVYQSVWSINASLAKKAGKPAKKPAKSAKKIPGAIADALAPRTASAPFVVQTPATPVKVTSGKTIAALERFRALSGQLHDLRDHLLQERAQLQERIKEIDIALGQPESKKAPLTNGIHRDTHAS